MLPPRAYIFIGLNAIRVVSIIALLLVFASNMVTLVHDITAVNRSMEVGNTHNSTTISNNSTANGVAQTSQMDYILGSTVPNQLAGAFFAVLNRLFIIFQTIILVFSEFGFPSKLFDRFFPVLGNDFGVGALGLFQMLLGAAILSHHVNGFTLASAFFLFSVGCLNIFVGLVFRETVKTKRAVTSWKEHAKSVLPSVGPINTASMLSSPPPFVSKLHTGSTFSRGSHSDNEKDDEIDGFKGFGFGRQGEKAAGLKGFLISKPVESLPRYAKRPGSTDF